VGEDRPLTAGAASIATRRPKADPESTGLRGHPLGLAERRTVARPTGAVSLGEHLLATPAGVGRAGRVAEDLADLFGPTGCARPTRLGRNVRRWQLCPGEKRGLSVGKTKRGKGTKWMVVVDGQGVPLGNLLDSASPAEVTLLEPTLETIAVPRHGPGRPRKKPERVVYDKACDSDPLRRRLARRGIELICPHRRNRVKPPLQDGRKLRRYRRRWKVERTFAWLGNFRRLVVRWERHIMMYRAFFHVACLLITLRQL
jgi:transposase